MPRSILTGLAIVAATALTTQTGTAQSVGNVPVSVENVK